MCEQPTSLIPIIENSSNIRVLDERGRYLANIYCCAESVQSNGLTITTKRKGSNTIDIYGWNGHGISYMNTIYG
jgi:hypothetical protein